MKKEVLVHGAMKYRCDKCGRSWWMFLHGRMVYACERCDRRWSMYLEKGIEEPGDDHKPSPFVIQCPFCGGMARDISGIIGFTGGGYYPLPKGASYFANKKDSDCGVPVLPVFLQ